MQRQILLPPIGDLTNALSVSDSVQIRAFRLETCTGPHNVETMCGDSYASEPALTMLTMMDDDIRQLPVLSL